MQLSLSLCYNRSQNIRESQQLSLQRNVDLHDLDVFGPGQSPRSSPASRKRKEPPTPPVKNQPLPPVSLKPSQCCMHGHMGVISMDMGVVSMPISTTYPLSAVNNAIITTLNSTLLQWHKLS